MALASQDISLKLRNNTNRKTTLPLLGGKQDPSDGQANAKTLYEWDLSAEIFANTVSVSIVAQTPANTTPKTYEAFNQDGNVTDIQTVLRLLNTLNLGVFSRDGNTIFIADDKIIFGDLKVNLGGIDIDDLVISAYNYFDPLSKSNFNYFKSLSKPLIKGALDNIPNFLSTIESNGWGNAYLGAISEYIVANRNVSGKIYVIKNNNSNIAFSVYDNLDGFTENSTNGILIFSENEDCFLDASNNLKPLEFGDSYIFNFKYKNNIRFDGNVDFVIERGWIPLDSSYFNSSENRQITIDFDTIENPVSPLDIYGNNFPSLNLSENEILRVSPLSSASDNLTLANQSGDAEIVFGDFYDNSALRFDTPIKSQNNVLKLNFQTLVRDPLGINELALLFEFVDSPKQTIILDSGFNQKIQKKSKTAVGGAFFFENENSTITNDSTDIIFEDENTPLILESRSIRFVGTRILNPPKKIQSLRPYEFNNSRIALDIDIRNQNYFSNQLMFYFNWWFYNIGTQDFVYDTNVNTGFLTFRTSDNGSFILSGEGLVGLQSLNDMLNLNPTVQIGDGIVFNNYGSFTINENYSDGVEILVQGVTDSLPFEVTYSEHKKNDVVIQSSSFPVNASNLFIPSPTEGNQNLIFTQDPDTSEINNMIIRGNGVSQSNIFTTFLFGNGTFNFGGGLGANAFNISGITIELPQSVSYPKESGLFKRDFSGLKLLNNLIINFFRINDTSYALNGSVLPYGSNRIFNFDVGKNFERITLNNCDFSYDVIDTINTKPLRLLFDDNIQFLDGIIIKDTDFNFADSGVGQPTNLRFAIDDGQGETALLDDAILENINFAPNASLLTVNFDSAYTGTQNTLTDLRLLDTDINQVFINPEGGEPPLNVLLSGASMQLFNSSNYNVTSINIDSNMVNLSTIAVDGCGLDSNALDQLIIEIEAIGSSNGSLNYDSQTTADSPNSSISLTAYNNLLSRGWTIVGNAPA